MKHRKLRWCENTCDRCGAIERSEDLIWITAPDFQPKYNEFVPPMLYRKYDALCEDCYLSLIKIKRVDKNESK